MATKAQLEAHIAALQAEIAAASATTHTAPSFDAAADTVAFSQFIELMMPSAPDMTRFIGKLAVGAIYGAFVGWLAAPYTSMLMAMTGSALLQACIYFVCMAALVMFLWFTGYHVVNAVFAAPAYIATAFNATKRVASQTLNTTVEYTNAAYTGVGSWVARKLSYAVAA